MLLIFCNACIKSKYIARKSRPGKENRDHIMILYQELSDL